MSLVLNVGGVGVGVGVGGGVGVGAMQYEPG